MVAVANLVSAMSLRGSPVGVMAKSEFAGSRNVSVDNADWNEDGLFIVTGKQEAGRW